MPDHDHRTAQARAIMHQAYLSAAHAMRGGNGVEIGTQDIANLDSLDAIVFNYMREISPENAIEQTEPRTIMTRTQIEAAARAAAVDVADGRMRALEEDIRQAAAELGRQAREAAKAEPQVIRMMPDGTRRVAGTYHFGGIAGPSDLSDESQGPISDADIARLAARDGFIGLRNGADLDDPGNLWSVSGVGDRPPPPEGQQDAHNPPHSAEAGEGATTLAGQKETPL